MATSARQLAWTTLLKIHRGAYADVALHNTLHHPKSQEIKRNDRALVTELVYGCVRRQRTLDTLIQQLANQSQKPALELRLLLHIGLYQLRYLSQIPPAAAVHTTVELCKSVGLPYGVGFVNAILRQYGRKAEAGEVLILPEDPLDRLGILHSYPRWIVETWQGQLQNLEELAALSEWFNQPPSIDVRVNPLRSSLAEVQQAFEAQGISPQPIPGLPQALTLPSGIGDITALPGFADGHWLVQDRSAQLVSHWLDPQPGEIVADACAAPGGKATHLAELMQDQGQVLAYDRTPSRLKKIQDNMNRLGLRSIEVRQGDSCHQPQLQETCDRALVDVPCSGLGTLHRHADARWTQTPETVQELVQLQQQILRSAATWVKPGGVLVYATCTLQPWENEKQIQGFLADHPQWGVELPAFAQHNPDYPWFLDTAQGLTLWPHRSQMDGFFMVRLRRQG